MPEWGMFIGIFWNKTYIFARYFYYIELGSNVNLPFFLMQNVWNSNSSLKQVKTNIRADFTHTVLSSRPKKTNYDFIRSLKLKTIFGLKSILNLLWNVSFFYKCQSLYKVFTNLTLRQIYQSVYSFRRPTAFCVLGSSS